MKVLMVSVRNEGGDLIYAEAQQIGSATNMEAETMAVWKALHYSKERGFEKVQVQTDSLSLKCILVGEKTTLGASRVD